MKVLMLGSGGREDSIHWKLWSEGHEMFAAPGNPGTAHRGKNVTLDILDPKAVADYVVAEGIDFTVVGPEAPLAAGIVDHFNARGLMIFGPTKNAARLTETSKRECCLMLEECGVPIPAFEELDSYEDMVVYATVEPLPFVIKYDGLAEGKGVRVVRSRAELTDAIEFFRGFNPGEYLIQELVEGPELSFEILADGRDFVFVGSAQDYKPLYPGGPNTGGMGGFAQHPMLTPVLRAQIEEEIVKPTLQGLVNRLCPYRGAAYFQIMLTNRGPVVIEINCRFGDPETQLLMPLLDCALLPLLLATTEVGSLRTMEAKFKPEVAVGIVLVSDGYPDKPVVGHSVQIDPMYYLAKQGDRFVHVFHAGTKTTDNHELVTSGGRVLTVVGVDLDYRSAKVSAEYMADSIQFEGKYFRHDIASGL